MPPDQCEIGGSADYPQSVEDRELKARVRVELARMFTLPSALRPVTRPLQDLSAMMDLGDLADVAASVNVGMELIFTLISKEYIQTGLNWINAMRRLGLSNFIVISGDAITSERLDEQGIRSVRGEIDESEFDTSFLTHEGFSPKGLAMIAFKFPVTRFLLKCGYNVIFSDADAVWLRDPMAYVRGADIAFQRVIYHPPSVSSLWGFTACTGFVSFRHDTRTMSFLDRCIDEHQSFYCDQVAMNVALLEGDPDWRCEQVVWTPPRSDVWNDEPQRRAEYNKLRPFPITGELRRDGLRVLALANDKFWRQRWVSGPLPDTVVICHPNAPKDDHEKMKVLNAMGVSFPPKAVDRTWTGERDRGAG